MVIRKHYNCNKYYNCYNNVNIILEDKKKRIPPSPLLLKIFLNIRRKL